jgi:hypothetical protein
MLRLECRILTVVLAAHVASGCKSDGAETTTTSMREMSQPRPEPASAGAAGSDVPAPAEPGSVPSDSRFAPLLNQTCEFRKLTDTCGNCLWSHCCESLTEFRSNPDASDFGTCLSDCRDNPPAERSCAEHCDELFPNGTATYAEAFACEKQFCGDATTCSEKPASECEACLRTRCTEEMLALDATRDGLLFENCVADCDDWDGPCYNECGDRYAGLMDAYVAWGNCQSINCPICNP